MGDAAGANQHLQLDAEGRFAHDMSCRSCGYNLKGIRPGDGCPECGADLACRCCGYSLRGIRPEGGCPECGINKDRMLYGNLLRFSDTKWLRRISRGFQCLGAGVLLSAVFPFDLRGTARFSEFSDMSELDNVDFCLPISVIILWLGYWMTTTPEPHVTAHATGADPRRRMARGLLTLAVLAYTVTTIWREQLAVMRDFIQLGALACEAVGAVLLYTWVHHLCSRMNNAAMAGNFRLGTVLAMAYFICGLYALGLAIAQPSGPGGGGVPALPGPPQVFGLLLSVSGGFAVLQIAVISNLMSKEITSMLRAANQGYDPRNDKESGS